MTAENKRNLENKDVGFAFAVVQDSEGRILLTWRGSKDKYDRTPWELPPAANQFSDKPETVLVRKIKQDWGVELKITGVVLNAKKEPLTETIFISGVNERRVVKAAYLTEIIGGQLKSHEEVTPHKLEFVSLDEALLRHLDDFTRLVIEELKNPRPT